MKKLSTNLLMPVYVVSFILGLAQCFESIFLPEFKTYFSLNYGSQMYALFAKNIPFLCFSVLIGSLTLKIGFKNCLVISLFLFGCATFLMIAALDSHSYPLLLTAFFIAGTGFNFSVVSGSPLLSELGSPKESSSRINLASGLGAVAQIIAPLSIALLIPVSVTSIPDKVLYIKGVFYFTAFLLTSTGIALLFFQSTVPPKDEFVPIPNTNKKNVRRDTFMSLTAIFLVIGVESGIFGLYRNFAEDPNIGALDSHQSQQMYTLYFALFALGRFTGGYVQKRISPVITLMWSVPASLVLIAATIIFDGTIALVAITAVGFFNSVFFPTLYAFSLEGRGKRKGQVSGILAMGFLGGAILPVIQGWIADRSSLQLSFGIAFGPYLFLLYLALYHFYTKAAPVVSQIK